MIADEMTSKCSIAFLDCRGYYDLAADIITTIIACFVLIKALANYRDLKVEFRLAIDLPHGQNLRQKMHINLINVAFLIVLIVHIVFSMILFTVANEKDGNAKIQDNNLQLWYQFTHLGVVQLLNCLIVVVGWLYWKTLNSFYTLKCLQTPLIYRECMHNISIAILISLAAVIIAGFIDSIWNYQGLQTVLNWMVLASELISTAFFITYRILYHRNIFSSVKLSRKAVQRQNIHNILVILTSLGRVGLCILDSISIDFETLRKYEADNNNNNCHDVLPYHALLLLFVRLTIDLLPAFVFTRIFNHPGKNNRSSSSAQQTLFSALPSDTSGI